MKFEGAERARQQRPGQSSPPVVAGPFCAFFLSMEDKQMNIEMVADKIMELKRREAIAKEERAMLEEQLAKAIAAKDEGTESRTAGNGKTF